MFKTKCDDKLPLSLNPFGMRCSIVASDRERHSAAALGVGDSAVAESTFGQAWPKFGS